MKENNPNRTCIVTGEERVKEQLLRFTLTPDGQVIPDFNKKLSGKGFYITNSRKILEQAVKRNTFKKLGKNITIMPNLIDIVENVLKNRALEAINLAKKAGFLITGFEKVKENLQKGKVAFIVEASNAGDDGANKIRAAAQNVEILTLFSVEELDRALNKVNTVHIALLNGNMAGMVHSQLHRWQDFNSQK